jgi:hypothetical protein
MAEPRSTLRYRPITGLLKAKPVAERRSRSSSRADVQEQEYEESVPRRLQPARQSPQAARRTWSKNTDIQADVRDTRPGDDDVDELPEEDGWEEEERLPRTQAPRRAPISRAASTASRRPRLLAQQPRKRGWLIWVGVLAILIPLLIGLYSLAWYFHSQGAQGTVSSRFGDHAPADTLVLGEQVVVARNSGGVITVYFVPADGGQGTKLVQALPQDKWGTPSLVIPSLSTKGSVLYLHLVGVPTYPNWAQPEATFRLQNTANGSYQAVPVVA